MFHLFSRLIGFDHFSAPAFSRRLKDYTLRFRKIVLGACLVTVTGIFFS